MAQRRFLSFALLLSSVAFVARAHAEDTYEKRTVEGPQYTAPLSQLTQPSYVPQSVALSGPRRITDWNPGEPMPPGYHPVARARRGLIIAGAVTLGSLYLFSFLAASEASTSALYLPVLGPFAQLASGDDGARAVLLLDGLGQAAGAIMLIAGATTTTTILVRNDLAEIRLAPTLSKQGGGFGLVGTF
jgi:hypothetical protein